MLGQISNSLVLVLLGYAALGASFAIIFVIFGVQKIDPEAHGAGIGFRLLIFPGSVAFWPMLLRRWASSSSEPPLERNPHQ